MVEDSMYELIVQVSRALEEAGVTYALTGSVASSIHGEPVFSADADFVVRMDERQARDLARRVPKSLFADSEMLVRAASERGCANLYDPAMGLKADISVLSENPYHAEVLRRARRLVLSEKGVSFWVVSPEDIVLMKLVWRKDSRSQKQWDNALGVVRVQGHQLDWAYLRRWAAELGVVNDLEQLMEEAGV